MTRTQIPAALPKPQVAPATFAGQRVAVVGLGIEGRDALHLLRREGAQITLVDDKPESELRSSLAEHGHELPEAPLSSTGDLGVLNRLDCLIASQGVPHYHPLLRAAAERGIPVYGPMQLALARWETRRQAPLIGITGSAGKTTTTTLVHRILQHAGLPSVAGGNIGQGLLEQLPRLGPETIVTAEISHTQLLRLTHSPQIAALLNVTPNHLDQFSWEQYQHLKRRIFAYQTADDHAVLPFDEPLAAAVCTPARIARFGIGEPPAQYGGSETTFAWSDGASLYLRCDGRDITMLAASELLIPGEHNLRNALAAIAITAELAPVEAVAETLRSFRGVPHRLEQVAVINDVRYINDSIATTPERTLAGLCAIPGPIVLLLGGRDKHLPLDPLVNELRRRVRATVIFGEAAPVWGAWLTERGLAPDAVVESLDQALALATERAQPGDAVLMSPAGTSFDQYPNFAARGDRFRSLVANLRSQSCAGGESEQRA